MSAHIKALKKRRNTDLGKAGFGPNRLKIDRSHESGPHLYVLRLAQAEHVLHVIQTIIFVSDKSCRP